MNAKRSKPVRVGLYVRTSTTNGQTTKNQERELQLVAERHGWEVVATATFVPAVKAAPGSGLRQRVLGLAGRFVLWLERTIGRLWAPFVADGLIVTAREKP